MTHQRKTKPHLRVRFLAFAVLRIGETKRKCVVYQDAQGEHHVRTKEEFKYKFEEI